jgi:5'-3' exonuclease
MLVNCIIDGNYLLSKLVFTLHKNNLLYGALQTSLENSIINYRKLYPFRKVYLVSDSREASWRKSIHNVYKAKRKRDSDIDWQFVYDTYSDFKKSLTTVSVMESPGLEGDDWISYIVTESNKKYISTLIISNDHDIKQLLDYNLDSMWINIMTNEMFNKQKVFLPINWEIFLDKIKSLPNDDIFNLNDNLDFINLFQRFSDKYEVSDVDGLESLMIKVISGDTSDNIPSVWKIVKNGKTRGIGVKGAHGIIKSYTEEFGDLDLDDPDLYLNIADIICEKKKLSKSQMIDIVKNIEYNMSLVDLRYDNFPNFVIEKMNYLKI